MLPDFDSGVAAVTAWACAIGRGPGAAPACSVAPEPPSPPDAATGSARRKEVGVRLVGSSDCLSLTPKGTASAAATGVFPVEPVL
jgi:hypothetical protein